MLRDSLIWELAVRAADTLRGWWRESAFVGIVRTPKATVPQKMHRAPWVTHVMSAREQSLSVHYLHRLRRRLLQMRTVSLGLYCLFAWACFSLVTVVRREQDVGSFACAAFFAVGAIPLLGSRQTLGEALFKSRLLHRLLTEWCGFSHAESATNKERLHPLRALLGAVVTAFPALWLSARTVGLGMLLLLLGVLLFSVPEWNAVLFWFIFPFLYLTPHPTVLLCALVALFCASYTVRALSGRRVLELSRLDAVVLLIALQLLVGGFCGMGRVRDGAVACLLTLLWFPMRQVLRARRWRVRCIRAACLSSSAVALCGVLQYSLGLAELKWVDVARFSDIGGRVSVFFQNPNVLAVYLLLCFPLLLFHAAKQKRMGGRVLCGLGILLHVTCMTLTWSRGAWLGMLLEGVLFLLFHSRTTLAVGLIAAPFVPSVLLLLPHSVKNRFASIGSQVESSVRYRLHTWRGTLRMISAHPCGIGVGEEAFVRTYPAYAVSGTERVMHAHQLFLQITAELGFVGLVSFCILIGACILRALRHGDAGGAAFALVGALAMGLFDHLWYRVGMLALFFSVCALSACGEEVA